MRDPAREWMSRIGNHLFLNMCTARNKDLEIWYKDGLDLFHKVEQEELKLTLFELKYLLKIYFGI